MHGGSDKRLTGVDTCNCCICKVGQYLACHKALLCAFMCPDRPGAVILGLTLQEGFHCTAGR